MDDAPVDDDDEVTDNVAGDGDDRMLCDGVDAGEPPFDTVSEVAPLLVTI